MTLREIADSLGMSIERVRQVEQRALRKIRHWSRLRFLAEFADRAVLERYLSSGHLDEHDALPAALKSGGG